MMEMTQDEYFSVGISFDGIDFTTIYVPKVLYKEFIHAWERGLIWKTGISSVSQPVKGPLRKQEFIRLSDVKRITIY